MTKAVIEQADAGYRQAEQKAVQYLAALAKQVEEKTYANILTEDIEVWKQKHLARPAWSSLFARGKRTPDERNYHRYIQWLNHTGRLDDYLDRSVSYMYMRDLGQALDAPATKRKIARMAADIKNYLLRSRRAPRGRQPEPLSLVGVYRWAQKEGVETAVIWVIEKLRAVSAHIPRQMNAEHAERKLIKVIIGVILHVLDEMDGETPPRERAQRLDEAIRLGYSYGLTYPFIDDLLDSEVLSDREKAWYSDMIRSALCTGTVPELDEGAWDEARRALVAFVHAELGAAFEYIRSLQRPDMQKTFFGQAYVFFQSQHVDRVKELSRADYTNEDIYVPVILKSSSSRSIVRSVIHAPEDEGFEQRTFYYGIYNQLADDFADLHDDLRDGAVTPYTYYLTHHRRRPDLINPFELYWAVITHLVHRVYRSDASTREVILDRAINGLKRCRQRLGAEKYAELMEVFAFGQSAFLRLVQHMVQEAEEVDFFDKLLRDKTVAILKNDREDKEAFLDTIRTVRRQLDEALPIAKPDGIPPMKETLIDAANYSIEGGGKRLRPILAWVMGVYEYGLQASAILPLARSLEYMHTASLIFDDLPSQDHAATRRGRPTLHRVHDSATAELTGLFLIQKAIQEQASLASFQAGAVLDLIRYSAERAEDLIMGQAMDLRAKEETSTLEQLNRICFFKTGVVFEASLVMPAILAGVKEADIDALKTYAYHAGIAFQIKDDLLDVEGEASLLGKPVGQDAGNHRANFVTVLGRDGAKRQMWEHFCLGMEALQDLPRKTKFLEHVLHYIVNRER